MLLIDNYDSFTYNIVQYLKILGVKPRVIKNDELTLNEITSLKFKQIIISPGWGSPVNSGVSMDVIDYYQDKLPIFGICLGMQCIASYFGADIVRAPKPCHGKNSEIFFDPNFKLFRGFEQGFSATSQIPMALKIRNKEIYGVQFHPEAILTENGLDIFRNFIELCQHS